MEEGGRDKVEDIEYHLVLMDLEYVFWGKPKISTKEIHCFLYLFGARNYPNIQDTLQNGKIRVEGVTYAS